MAVAFRMFIKELSNGGETAENSHLPQNFFLPFLAELYISELFEPNLYFFKKNYPSIFAFNTNNNSNILLFNQKCSVQMLG